MGIYCPQEKKGRENMNIPEGSFGLGGTSQPQQTHQHTQLDGSPLPQTPPPQPKAQATSNVLMESVYNEKIKLQQANEQLKDLALTNLKARDGEIEKLKAEIERLKAEIERLKDNSNRLVGGGRIKLPITAQEVRHELAEGMSISKIATKYEVSRRTVARRRDEQI